MSTTAPPAGGRLITTQGQRSNRHQRHCSFKHVHSLRWFLLYSATHRLTAVLTVGDPGNEAAAVRDEQAQGLRRVALQTGSDSVSM